MSYLSTLQGLPGVSSIWLLDEASGMSLADSQGPLTLTSHAGMTVGAASIVPALAHSALNSSGYASTAANLPTVGGGDFWLAFWVKSTDGGTKRVIGDSGGHFLAYCTAGKLIMDLETVQTTMATAFNDGVAHCVVISRASGAVKIYLDPAGSTPTPDVSAANAGVAATPSRIGVGADEAGGSAFAGSLGGIGFGVGSGLTGAQASAINAAGRGGGAATSYTLAGPTSGVVNAASANFTVTPVGGAYSGTITPHTAGAGTFSPTGLTFSGSTPQAFTYTPTTTAGTPHAITTTAGPPLGTDPPAINYAVGTGTVAISAPVANQFRWRGAAGSAAFAVSGTYSGSPTAIEWSRDGSTWSTLVASPSGGAYSGSVTLPTGQYTLAVRFAGDHAVSASVGPVSVAYVFATGGQSQWGRGTNNQTALYSPSGHVHAQKTLAGYAALADPVGVTVDAGTTGTPLIAMATGLGYLLGAPVGIVAAAQGGTDMTSWTPATQPDFAYLVAATQAVGGADAVLFWEGESDAQAGTGQAGFHGSLASVVAAVRSALANCPVLVPLLEHQDPAAVPQAGQDAINAAIAQGYGGIVGLFPGPDFRPVPTLPEDQLHLKTDQKVATVGGLWAGAICAALAPAAGAGPAPGIGSPFIKGN